VRDKGLAGSRLLAEKSCAEYRSGTKQECGVSKPNLPKPFRFYVNAHASLSLTKIITLKT